MGEDVEAKGWLSHRDPHRTSALLRLSAHRIRPWIHNQEGGQSYTNYVQNYLLGAVEALGHTRTMLARFTTHKQKPHLECSRHSRWGY